MGKKHEIWQQVDRRHGFTEPGNDYFEKFSARLMDNLPEPEFPEQKPITLWSRIQPWVYMAAMFAGIALVVRIFTTPSTETDLYSEEPCYEEYYEELIWSSNVSDCAVYEYIADVYEH